MSRHPWWVIKYIYASKGTQPCLGLLEKVLKRGSNQTGGGMAWLKTKEVDLNVQLGDGNGRMNLVSQLDDALGNCQGVKNAGRTDNNVDFLFSSFLSC